MKWMLGFALPFLDRINYKFLFADDPRIECEQSCSNARAAF
jgi:hypothetical protein